MLGAVFTMVGLSFMGSSAGDHEQIIKKWECWSVGEDGALHPPESSPLSDHLKELKMPTKVWGLTMGIDMTPSLTYSYNSYK